MDDELVRALKKPGSATVVRHASEEGGLATVLLDQLGTDVGLVVTVDKPGSADQTLAAVASALTEAALVAGHAPTHPWRALAGPLANPGHSWGARFDALAVHVLPNYPLVLVVENAELAVDDTGEFRDPTLAGLLAVWAARAARSRMLVLTRAPLRLPGARVFEI